MPAREANEDAVQLPAGSPCMVASATDTFVAQGRQPSASALGRLVHAQAKQVHHQHIREPGDHRLGSRSTAAQFFTEHRDRRLQPLPHAAGCPPVRVQNWGKRGQHHIACDVPECKGAADQARLVPTASVHDRLDTRAIVFARQIGECHRLRPSAVMLAAVVQHMGVAASEQHNVPSLEMQRFRGGFRAQIGIPTHHRMEYGARKCLTRDRPRRTHARPRHDAGLETDRAQYLA